jgi:hypothetical protein
MGAGAFSSGNVATGCGTDGAGARDATARGSGAFARAGASPAWSVRGAFLGKGSCRTGLTGRSGPESVSTASSESTGERSALADFNGAPDSDAGSWRSPSPRSTPIGSSETGFADEGVLAWGAVNAASGHSDAPQALVGSVAELSACAGASGANVGNGTGSGTGNGATTASVAARVGSPASSSSGVGASHAPTRSSKSAAAAVPSAGAPSVQSPDDGALDRTAPKSARIPGLGPRVMAVASYRLSLEVQRVDEDFVGHHDGLRIRLIPALRQDHLREFLRDVDVRLLESRPD